MPAEATERGDVEPGRRVAPMEEVRGDEERGEEEEAEAEAPDEEAAAVDEDESGW